MSLVWGFMTWVVYCGMSTADTIAPRYADARYSEEDFLPVRSEALTPGPVKRQALQAAGLPSFFLVGDDPMSKSWLKQRHSRLVALKAVGLVVNVQSKTALEQLRQVAPGLKLSPVSADDLAQRLKLQHYPVLITADRLEQ
ncbi:integrating conjugative element protein [Pseudomonas sp. 91RF]|jgi:integrating conjugative element protein (TIGR03765 family)|uniref:integrating conjugative element protein n=1 Tax=Pseudomonas sp. 91RF TaxID=2292261 RepID=UPI000E66C7C2|nr:integrating conjugative element protein [Pseudomonas sp. 91RF]RIJ09684.1 integrating conjugative element protein [Pseudomonas sp. 91RF]